MSDIIKAGDAVTMTSIELVDFINGERKKLAEAAGAVFPSAGYAALQHKDFLEKVPVVLGESTSAEFSANLPDSYGRPRKGYRFVKREACLMAMSYSYDLQAKVFDRMTALEETKSPDPMQVLNDPAAMRGLLLSYTEKVIGLEAKVAEQAPKVEVHDRIADAAGAISLRETATTIGYPERKMILWMQQKDWIYRRAGHKNLLAYAAMIKCGYLVHKVTPIVDANTGQEKISEQVLVTPLGLTVLARRLALGDLPVPPGAGRGVSPDSPGARR